MPPVLPDGIHLLGRWLDRAGYHDASQRVEQRGQVMETISEQNSQPSWDPLGGPEFYTRRGGLIPAVFRAVEQYFRNQWRPQSAPTIRVIFPSEIPTWCFVEQPDTDRRALSHLLLRPQCSSLTLATLHEFGGDRR